MKDTRHIILEIISAQCGIDWPELQEDMVMSDNLGLDSLDMVEIVIKLENELDMDIPDREADEAFNVTVTISDIIEYILSKLEVS